MNIYKSVTGKHNSIEGLVWNKVWSRKVVEKHVFRTDVSIVDDAVFSWEALKDAKRVCYCDLPLYHYRIIPSSITRNSSVDKYMKALYGYELMIEDAKNISDVCVRDLVEQYLGWCTSAFYKIAMQDNPDMEAYKKIQRNCKLYQNDINKMAFSERKVACLSIIKGFRMAQFAALLILKVKDIKMAIKNMRASVGDR